jgi:dephospho-CoA kinase
MLKVGITGGMGSGKTTVCKIFETLGIPTYYADDRAKYLMSNDEGLIEKIKTIFGPDAYQKDQQLNRKYIADIAFKNPQKLKKLNAVVHPAVFKDGEKWHNSQKNVPYTLKEAALLYESGSYKKLDKMITVTAPLEIRIKRILERDDTTREAILARIENQWSDEKKVTLSDYIIYNDGHLSLIEQVLKIHSQLKIIAKTV